MNASASCSGKKFVTDVKEKIYLICWILFLHNNSPLLKKKHKVVVDYYRSHNTALSKAVLHFNGVSFTTSNVNLHLYHYGRTR